MSNAYLLRMPAGIPGALTRLEACTVVPEVYAASNYPTAFGVPVKFSSGKISKLTGSEGSTDIVGWLVRPYPTQYTSSEALETSTPNPSTVADIMKRGYMTIHFGGTTAAKGGQVYVRVTAGDSGNAVGNIEEGADGGECIAVTNCFFTGAADASGNVEISYNIER